MNKIYSKIKALYYRQQFYPGALGVLLNPFYFERVELFKYINKFSVSFSGRILDVGCGSKPYKKLFRVKEYVGLEYSKDNSNKFNAEFTYNGEKFPFNNNEFDGLVSFQVLEHVFEPQKWLTEIQRVLKPQGLLLLTVPLVWDEHETPYDYARYTSYGLKHILEKNGFEIIETAKTASDVRVVFQFINVYLYKITMKMRKTLIGDIIATLLFNSVFNILGILLSYVVPNNKDLYLNNVVLSKKI